MVRRALCLLMPLSLGVACSNDALEVSAIAQGGTAPIPSFLPSTASDAQQAQGGSYAATARTTLHHAGGTVPSRGGAFGGGGTSATILPYTTATSGGRTSIAAGGRTQVSTWNTSTGGTTTASGGASDCPESGNITYALARSSNPSAEETAAYEKITLAMDDAVKHYNCYTNITKSLSVTFAPNVETADANINGTIRFGSLASMNRVTAMHEISHTVGIGTSSKWSSFVVGGQFTGSNALAQLLKIEGRDRDTIGADKQHFWPFGLNYESEGKNLSDRIGHCQMVMAIRKDLGMN